MVITKTRFLDLTRCDRFISLENNLPENVSYDEYEKEKLTSLATENLNGENNKNLEAMLPLYKEVEVVSAEVSQKYFDGTFIFAENTKDQKEFIYQDGKIKYLCYVDIYNESGNDINIIEVKATTNKKYEELKSGYERQDKYSIFFFDAKKNCYYLKDEINGYNIEKEMPIEKYNQEKAKLFSRFKDVGIYVYDLAVQRFIIENSLPKSNIHYYLAVLNSHYTFDGHYENGKAIYKADAKGNEVITFIDLTKVTKEYQEHVRKDAKVLKENLEKGGSKSFLGDYCMYKQTRECPYFKTVCGKSIPANNSSLDYLNNGRGFKMEDGKVLKGLELINAGYLSMLDIPREVLHNPKHIIQRDALENLTPYIDKEKLKEGLNSLKYPIYHLDFETIPCPLPRFRGEHPYTQSPFEFSLHIEKEPGVCDELEDNYIFLAKSFNEDEREHLLEKLFKRVDVEKGCLFAQNVAFEKGRLMELASAFPKYREKITKLVKNSFDLLWLVNTSSKLYESLGFSEERSKLPNFYDERLSGSYSIKKTLPVFSNLSYKNLNIKCGNDALASYATYNYLTEDELNKCYDDLKIYCRQDTWAMVVILDELRKLI